MLRYQSKAPATVYASGIEKVIATYHVDVLDKNQYRLISCSAAANSNLLKGKKKHRFLDRVQRQAPLNRATVIVIYAKRVDEGLRAHLFDMVCKDGGDGLDTAVLPCVVDLEKGICTFDSMRIPYLGVQHPAKNRGIRIIRKCLFDNRFPFAGSPDRLEPILDDLDQSLWAFWRTTKKERIIQVERERKRFQKMGHREVILEDGDLYVKWGDHGITIPVKQNDERREVEIAGAAVDIWNYPKNNKIAKDTVRQIKALIDAYFAGLGYTTKYNS